MVNMTASYSPKHIRLFISLAKKRIYLNNCKESLLICFENCQGDPYSHRQSRNRMMNTFIIINIIPTSKRYFRGLIYACPLQKGFPSPFSLARNRIYLDTRLKVGITDLFWKLPGYSLLPYKQSRQSMVKNFLLMVKIKTICNR